MKNQLRYTLIIFFAFIAGVLTFALYQKFSVSDETVSSELPIVQTDKQNLDGNFGDTVISPDNKSFAHTKTVGTTPAFDELSLHLAKVKSELNSLLLEYQRQAPEVLVKQFELDLTQIEMAKISAMPEAKKPTLDFVYGKLLVRKIVAETDLQDAVMSYGVESTQAHKKVERLQAIEKEIAEFSPSAEKSKVF